MPVHGIITGTYYRRRHPQNITLSIQDVFIIYMDKVIEHNENLDTPINLSSHLEHFNKKMISMKYQILKQRYHDMIIVTIGYNKIYYKLNNSNTDSSITSY